MKTNWQELSKKLGVLKEDNSELYQGKNSSEALEEIFGDAWLQETLDSFIDGKPGNELAIKTLRFISSPKAAAMAFKIYNENKDINSQKASLAVWALSDIRTELSMDYAERIIERPEYEGIAIAVIRNLIYDHIHLFTEEKILTVLNKISSKNKEDIEPLREFVQKYFHPKKWYSLLDTIMKRPALYAIQRVEDLYIFWLGYSTSLDLNNLSDDELNDFDTNFTDFIKNDYPSVPYHCNWCTAIRLYSTSDHASVELFFEELAKYKSGDENFDRVKFRENYRKN
jgi:hypothetical protein